MQYYVLLKNYEELLQSIALLTFHRLRKVLNIGGVGGGGGGARLRILGGGGGKLFAGCKLIGAPALNHTK